MGGSEQYRQRLAEELNDRVIRPLFGIGLMASSLEGQATDPLVREHVRQIVEALDDAIAEGRSMLFEAMMSQPDAPGDQRRPHAS